MNSIVKPIAVTFNKEIVEPNIIETGRKDIKKKRKICFLFLINIYVSLTLKKTL